MSHFAEFSHVIDYLICASVCFRSQHSESLTGLGYVRMRGNASLEANWLGYLVSRVRLVNAYGYRIEFEQMVTSLSDTLDI